VVGGQHEVDPCSEVVRELGIDDVDLVADDQSGHQPHAPG
jgi:hypothetical protein